MYFCTLIDWHTFHDAEDDYHIRPYREWENTVGRGRGTQGWRRDYLGRLASGLSSYGYWHGQGLVGIAYQQIRGRGAVPILCGGTGLYIEAVLKGYHLSPVPQNQPLRDQLEGKSLDELTAILQELKLQNGSVMHNTTDVDSCQRAIRAIEIETYNREHPMPLRELPAIPSIIIGVSIDRELRREKITRRLKARLDEGMVDEVRRLLDEGIPADDLIYYGLEYKYLTEYIIGRLSYEEMFRLLEIAIHQFAKRQMTWFRGMERRGFNIDWIDATLPMEEKVNIILDKWQ